MDAKWYQLYAQKLVWNMPSAETLLKIAIGLVKPTTFGSTGWLVCHTGVRFGPSDGMYLRFLTRDGVRGKATCRSWAAFMILH